MKRTIIEKHPLRNCYMLYCPALGFIPPYFGTLKQCQKAQKIFEEKIKGFFN